LSSGNGGVGDAKTSAVNRGHASSSARCYVRRVTAKNPFATERWRVWHLDSELRYRPVLDALPPEDGRPICEVGSGPSGLAAWTARPVIGIDPGEDQRHGPLVIGPPNLRRERSSGSHIPLEDSSVAAAVAVDTLEHISANERAGVISEMARVTSPRGRVILVGPAGKAAAAGDAWLLSAAQTATRDVSWVEWLHEHEGHGLPSVDDLVSLLLDVGAQRITARGLFNIRLWKVMHLVGLGKLPEPRDPVYGLLWRPFGELARRYRRGPFYRWVVIGEM
jgi:hypothetical protein